MGLSCTAYLFCDSIKESFAALHERTGNREKFGAASFLRARHGAGLSTVRKNMSWIAKAALAAALLNCGLLNASATDTSNGQGSSGQWLKDGACSLFSAGAGPGDTVSWTGSCVEGYAEGLGTATFTPD